MNQTHEKPTANPSSPCPNLDDPTPMPARPPQKGPVAFWAAVLSGLIVGTLTGLIGALPLAGPDKTDALIGATLGGAFVGAIALRRIAACDWVVSGAAIGGVLPFGLILIDGIRSGRLADAKAADFTDPKALLILGGLLVGGVTVGAMLVVVKKALVWIMTGGT